MASELHSGLHRIEPDLPRNLRRNLLNYLEDYDVKSSGYNQKCNPGCISYCCIDFSARLSEFVLMLNYTIEHGFDSLFERQMSFERTIETDLEKRTDRNPICFFLQQDYRCSVYPLRPLICRNYGKLDGFCQENHRQGIGSQAARRINNVDRQYAQLFIENLPKDNPIAKLYENHNFNLSTDFYTSIQQDMLTWLKLFFPDKEFPQPKRSLQPLALRRLKSDTAIIVE